MIEIAHINDDPRLGGITRSVPNLCRQLDPVFNHTMHILDPKRSRAPDLGAQIIIVHFPPSWASLPWLLALRLRNRKARIVLNEHSYTRGFEALHVTSKRRFRRMLWLSCRLADHVATVSAAQGEWMCEAAGLPAHKLTAINPMTDLTALRALPLPQRQPGPLRLCGYGRFSVQKGFDDLINAMRMVPRDLVTLRLVGLGEDEAALRAQAAGLPHVTVEGPAPGPEALLGDVDAVAIPSRFEAFGNAGAEARAAARPMIVTGVDGLIDQALPGVPELMVEPGDIQGLAGAIIWLAGQDITALGAAARRSVEGSEARTIDAWNALLHRLAA
jgi:glycosyltransferase involved in cell wall biosynthesis